MCRQGYELTANPLKTIEMLTCTSNIAKTLMLDLLDLAQLENNTFKMSLEDFSLVDVIQNAFSMVKHIADTKIVELVA
jgi:signal transduction histidine kinase